MPTRRVITALLILSGMTGGTAITCLFWSDYLWGIVGLAMAVILGMAGWRLLTLSDKEKGPCANTDQDEMKTYQSNFTPTEQLIQLWAWWDELIISRRGTSNKSSRIFKVIMRMRVASGEKMLIRPWFG